MTKVYSFKNRLENGIDHTAVDSKTDKNMASGCLAVKTWSKEKILTTLCLFMEMTVWGMYIGMMNSSMLDLELLTGSSTAQISFIWTAFTAGCIFMGPIAGFLLDKSDSRLYLGLSQLGFGVLLACLPHADSFAKIMGIAASLGIFLALLDIGRNITAVKLWGWDGAMWLQFFHFIFAVGSAVSPLFTKPFLAMPLNGINTNSSHTNIVSDNVTCTTVTSINATEEEIIMSESRIHIPFAIVGGLGVCSGIFSLIAFLTIRKTKMQQSQKKKEGIELKVHKHNRCYVVVMVMLLFLRFFFIVGVEVSVGALQMTFLVKGLGWTKSEAVMAVFALRVAFAAARGLGVGLATFITPTKLMFLDIFLLLISFTLLWISEETWIVWVSTVLMGIGMATFYSASMSWAEKYLQISGRIGGFFLIGSGCGVLAFPPLGGYLFEKYTPWSFVYLCFGITLMLLITTICSATLGWWYRKKHRETLNIELPELNTSDPLVNT